MEEVRKEAKSREKRGCKQKKQQDGEPQNPWASVSGNNTMSLCKRTRVKIIRQGGYERKIRVSGEIELCALQSICQK